MRKKKKTDTQDIQKNKVNLSYIPTCNDLVFIPLGGTSEIGMNMALIGHDGEWLIIDCGITFYDRLGIEVLTADPTFIVHHQKKLKGVLLTHAHEDHIGALEYLWPLLKCPVYAAPFAATVFKQKIHDKPWKSQVSIIEMPFKKNVNIGKFEVEFVQMTHSIPDPSCLIIKSPLGTLVHTGDWKFDLTPVIGKKSDEKRLKQIGDEGVLAYFSDSTNIFTKEDVSSEKHIRDSLIHLVDKYKNKRITISCFSSNIARLETAILAAHQAGRKVVVIGHSLQKMIAVAKDTGYLLRIPPLIDEKTAASMPSEKVLLICTGSQGEERSALMRIATGKHPLIKMNDHDLVLFSSRVIPGNEKNIGRLHSLLAQAGADIITASEENIHASGHPSRKAIKKMYEILRPQIVIPVHGEARHLIAQSHFAKEHGISHVITPSNGTIIQMAGQNPSIIGYVQHGRWAVDGKRMVVFHKQVIQERVSLSEQGVVFATLVLDKNTIQKIYVKIRGLMDSGKFYEDLQKHIIQSIEDLGEKICGMQNNPENISSIEQSIRKTVYSKIGKKPVVDVHIVEI